jgi:hypothetical protein
MKIDRSESLLSIMWIFPAFFFKLKDINMIQSKVTCQLMLIIHIQGEINL